MTLSEEELDKRLLEAERVLASLRPRPLPVAVQARVDEAKAEKDARNANREFRAGQVRKSRESREKGELHWKR